MSLQMAARYLKSICLEDRGALLKEIFPVQATLLHRPLFVAAYGGTMSEMTVKDTFLGLACRPANIVWPFAAKHEKPERTTAIPTARIAVLIEAGNNTKQQGKTKPRGDKR